MRSHELAQVLGVLKGVRSAAGGHQALCPCHDDETPSLSISEKDGKVLVKCHAGCSQEVLIQHFRDAGVWPGTGKGKQDLPPIPKAQIKELQQCLTDKQRAHLKKSRCLSDDVIDRYQLGLHDRRVTIPVLDASGQCRNIRRWLDPGLRKNGAAKVLSWEKGRGRPLLYPVDQLKESRLCLVEGELDALALISHGVPAMTVTAGVTTWPPHLSDGFHGKGVTIITDNDEPGLKGAKLRAGALSTAGAVVRVVVWPDGRPTGHDVTDELLQHGIDSLQGVISAAIPHVGIEVVSMATVEPEDVEWLWHPYIARGKITLIEGDPGLGKSWLSLALASNISRGSQLPNDSPRSRCESTLLMTCEDGLGDTIRPRLDALGADVDKVKAVNQPLVFDDAGLQGIENALRAWQFDLLIVDPLVGYLGGSVDLHKANEVREVMARLANLAQRYRCAVICIRHLTKSTRSKSIYRGMGSIDLTAAARSVLLVGGHPEKGRGLVHIKSNLAPQGPAIGYTLDAGQFEWTGISDLTPQDILADEGKEQPVDEAEEFLTAALSDGPVPAREIFDLAEAERIAKATVKRAKKNLGVHSYKDGLGGGWVWELAARQKTAPDDRGREGGHPVQKTDPLRRDSHFRTRGKWPPSGQQYDLRWSYELRERSAVTTALGLLYHLDSLGIQLRAEGDDIRFRAPGGVLTNGLRELVRTNKAELVSLLRLRRTFGYKEATLFRLIDHQVATPQGPGILLSVFRRYCRIELERTGAVVLHRPAEIIALAVAEFAAAEVAA